MAETQALADDVRSFVAFALAMKPGVVMQTREDENAPRMSLTISTEEAEAEAKIASLEPLMERYRPLRSFLNALRDSTESVNDDVTTNFRPGVEYQLHRISDAQFRVAKELASRLDRIHVLHEAGYPGEASREHDAFNQYLGEQRRALIGDFTGVQFTDAIANYGADRVVNPDNNCAAVVFVIIEIYLV
jgi:hypothetical protein